jgi:tetratricopeptide (TPR) repeat protein
LCGQLEEGRSRLEEALTALTSIGSQVGLALFRVWRGEVLGLQGHLEEAEEQARGALDLARERGCRGYEACALRVLAELAARRTSHSSATTRYGEALTLAEELGMRPLIAHCHLGLGKLDRRTGKRDQAHEHFTTAAAMYREMDMRFWLEQAKAE